MLGNPVRPPKRIDIRVGARFPCVKRTRINKMGEIAKIRAFISSRDFGAKDHLAREAQESLNSIELMLTIKRASERLEHIEWKKENSLRLEAESNSTSLNAKIVSARQMIRVALRAIQVRGDALSVAQAFAALNAIDRRLSGES